MNAEYMAEDGTKYAFNSEGVMEWKGKKVSVAYVQEDIAARATRMKREGTPVPRILEILQDHTYTLPGGRVVFGYNGNLLGSKLIVSRTPDFPMQTGKSLDDSVVELLAAEGLEDETEGSTMPKDSKSGELPLKEDVSPRPSITPQVSSQIAR